MLVCLIPSTYVETCSPVLGPAVLCCGNDVASRHLRICRGLTQSSGLRYTSSIWPWPGVPKVGIRTVQRIGLHQVVPRFEPFERCCMAILFVGGRGKTMPHPTSPLSFLFERVVCGDYPVAHSVCFQWGKIYDFLLKGVILCIFFSALFWG